MTCTTHHHACDCREEQYRRIEAALRRIVDADPRRPSLVPWVRLRQIMRLSNAIYSARALLAELDKEANR